MVYDEHGVHGTKLYQRKADKPHVMRWGNLWCLVDGLSTRCSDTITGLRPGTLTTSAQHPSTRGPHLLNRITRRTI